LREFETTFVVQPEISDEACTDLCGRLDTILESKGARRVMLDDWGKRKLAYEIQRFQKGHYFVLYYLDKGTVVSELERTLRLEESVLRFLTVRAKDRVADLDARVAEGIEEERIQREKAAERAAREAEAERQAHEAAAAAAAASAEAQAQAREAAEAASGAEAEAGEAAAEKPTEAGEAAAEKPTEDESSEADAAAPEDVGEASEENADDAEKSQE
jgi:small subunit ribosomal protein S6